MNTKLLEKKMENISPFELKNRLIDMAGRYWRNHGVRRYYDDMYHHH